MCASLIVGIRSGMALCTSGLLLSLVNAGWVVDMLEVMIEGFLDRLVDGSRPDVGIE